MASAVIQEPELITDPELIYSELEAHCPDVLTQSGLVMNLGQTCVLQGASESDMSANFIIVTRSKDINRNGNQVQITPGKNGQGLDLTYYQQNPLVLWDHGLGFNLPIAKSEDPSGKFSVKTQASKVTATAYFSQSLAFASEVFGLISEQILRAASIGFRPQKAMKLNYQPKDKPQDNVLDLQSFNIGYDFTQSELQEWSVVPIGADRGSLRQCLDRGKIGQAGKLSYPMRYWLSQHAEAKPAIGIGFVPPAVQQAAGAIAEVVAPVVPAATVMGQAVEEVVVQNPAEVVVAQAPTEPVSQPSPPMSTTGVVTASFEGISISGPAEIVTQTISLLTAKVQKPQESFQKPVDTNSILPVNAPPTVVQASPQSQEEVLISCLSSQMPAFVQLLQSQISEALRPLSEQQKGMARQLQMMTGGTV